MEVHAHLLPLAALCAPPSAMREQVYLLVNLGRKYAPVALPAPSPSPGSLGFEWKWSDIDTQAAVT